uniref:Uncharacterized protein n=1 Tax=Seriola lalandi dorsalis TaxID=1841481 RepID=A0A3B4X1Q7_SERLL
MICLLAPTAKELELAEKVTGNLAELTGQVAPCDVSSIYGIRKAMGIAVPPEPPEPFIDLTTGKTPDTTCCKQAFLLQTCNLWDMQFLI